MVLSSHNAQKCSTTKNGLASNVNRERMVTEELEGYKAPLSTQLRFRHYSAQLHCGEMSSGNQQCLAAWLRKWIHSQMDLIGVERCVQPVRVKEQRDKSIEGAGQRITEIMHGVWTELYGLQSLMKNGLMRVQTNDREDRCINVRIE